MIFHIKFTYDISLEYHINITCYYKTHLTVINDFEALCSNVIHVLFLDVIIPAKVIIFLLFLGLVTCIVEAYRSERT